MLHVVCYDIIDDKVRDQVSETLLDFGTRIQDSVFECLLDEDMRARLGERLGRLKLDERDKIRFYKMCQRCVEGVEIWGPGEVTRDVEAYFVYEGWVAIGC